MRDYTHTLTLLIALSTSTTVVALDNYQRAGAATRTRAKRSPVNQIPCRAMDDCPWQGWICDSDTRSCVPPKSPNQSECQLVIACAAGASAENTPRPANCLSAADCPACKGGCSRTCSRTVCGCSCQG